jgi:hypothetical protein
MMGKSHMKKQLLENPRDLLGGSYIYVEKLVLAIRNNPDMFNEIVVRCPSNIANHDLLIESLAFSFFEDLMNPENSELDLLKAINNLIRMEFNRNVHITQIFNENVSSFLSKMLLFYTKRRSQRKYLKLVFKKALLKIVHGEMRDLRLDPKEIFNKIRKQREVFTKVPEPAQTPKPKTSKIKNFFGIGCKKPKHKEEPPKPYQPPEEYDSAYCLQDEEVKKTIEQLSQIIIGYCQSLLQALYSNVKTMPYGLRLICKNMNELIYSKLPDISESERNIMLGTFLFTRWWVPSIIQADNNGLLQDTIISTLMRTNLTFIGNVRFI